MKNIQNGGSIDCTNCYKCINDRCMVDSECLYNMHLPQTDETCSEYEPIL